MSPLTIARRPVRRALPAVVLAALVSGCNGDGPFPVEGRVVWEDTGAPAKELKLGQVVFDLPEKQTSARGSIQEDGTFRLTTYKPNDGALAGEYKVMVLEVGLKLLPGGDGSTLAPGALDFKYSDPRTTDLTATVKPGTNQITLTVKRAGKK
jgi:hypothetical protein